MARYCAGCKSWHDPDLPCFNATEQMKRDIGIPQPKGRGGGTGRLSSKTIILMLLGFVAVVLLGALFSAFVL